MASLPYQPKERGFYAFNFERAGDFLIYVDSTKDCHKFLYIPGASPFYLSFQDFTKAMQQGMLTLVEELPEDVFNESLELSCPS
jgi:hypothetical protein